MKILPVMLMILAALYMPVFATPAACVFAESDNSAIIVLQGAEVWGSVPGGNLEVLEIQDMRIIAHPLLYNTFSLQQIIELDVYQAMEVWSTANDRVLGLEYWDSVNIGRVQAGKPIAWGTASDDFHSPSQVGLYWVNVLVNSDNVTADLIIDGLEAGNFYFGNLETLPVEPTGTVTNDYFVRYEYEVSGNFTYSQPLLTTDNITPPPPDYSAGKWVKCSLHSHTTKSDGALTEEQVVSLYTSKGYKFLAITDHVTWQPPTPSPTPAPAPAPAPPPPPPEDSDVGSGGGGQPLRKEQHQSQLLDTHLR